MRLRIAVGACAAVVLAGCNARTTGETKEAVPLEVSSGTATLTAEPGNKPEGRFYAIIGGETSNDNRLYELRFTPPTLTLLTETRRVSSVGACRDRVVVAAGQAEVGFSDHLQELRQATLGPIDTFGVQPGFTPELDRRCRMAYTWVDRDTEPLIDELRLWDPATNTATTLHRNQPGDGPLVSPDWGPQGEVAIVRRGPEHAGQLPAGTPKGRPAAIIIARSDGSSSEVPLTGNPGVLAWGKNWIAVMEDSEGTIFVNLTGSDRAILKGWYPLTWSPDGDQLLVHDAATRQSLGLVDTTDLGTVKPVGRVSGPVWDADWIPAEN
jgi:hypothetical protein